MPQNYRRYKVDFLHAGTNLLKLQIDEVILYEWGQAYPGMPKEAFNSFMAEVVIIQKPVQYDNGLRHERVKTLRSQKLKEL